MLAIEHAGGAIVLHTVTQSPICGFDIQHDRTGPYLQNRVQLGHIGGAAVLRAEAEARRLRVAVAAAKGGQRAQAAARQHVQLHQKAASEVLRHPALWLQ